MNSKICTFLFVFVFAGLAACGRKGDLYMPEHGHQAAPSVTSEASVADESDSTEPAEKQK